MDKFLRNNLIGFGIGVIVCLFAYSFNLRGLAVQLGSLLLIQLFVGFICLIIWLLGGLSKKLERKVTQAQKDKLLSEVKDCEDSGAQCIPNSEWLEKVAKSLSDDRLITVTKTIDSYGNVHHICRMTAKGSEYLYQIKIGGSVTPSLSIAENNAENNDFSLRYGEFIDLLLKRKNNPKLLNNYNQTISAFICDCGLNFEDITGIQRWLDGFCRDNTVYSTYCPTNDVKNCTAKMFQDKINSICGRDVAIPDDVQESVFLRNSLTVGINLVKTELFRRM